MDKLIADTIASPTWVFSVVVMGLCVNIAAMYLKMPIDRALSSASSWWGRRSAPLAAARSARIEALRAEPHEQVLVSLQASRYQVAGIALVAAAAAYSILLVAYGVLAVLLKHSDRSLFDEGGLNSWMGVVVLFVATWGMVRLEQSSQLEAELREATRRRDATP